jgi:hypothetical protein
MVPGSPARAAGKPLPDGGASAFFRSQSFFSNEFDLSGKRYAGGKDQSLGGHISSSGVSRQVG